ncbi:MAG: aldose 1-epimerase family protein, partial [Bacteroidaceae bacterium]|nr:aldose 1-epimerase family protein [Bacteroidaceae bacterium]
MKTISNGKLAIAVKEHGAELASIVSNGREYLWQADEAFWKRHSPVLFPIVGAVWNGEYRSHGNAYKMGQHGFARDMDFSLVKESETELRYRLLSNEQTKQKYPYDFCLEIGYQLMDNRIKVMWHVENTGCEKMSFQIGAHPAFFWPMLTNEQIEGGVGAMTDALANTNERGFFRLEAKQKTMPISVITEGGCVGRESQIEIDD